MRNSYTHRRFILQQCIKMQRENDVYLDEVWKHWEGIIMLYRQFEDKNPVMLLDIQEQRVYTYPYNELKRTLSK